MKFKTIKREPNYDRLTLAYGHRLADEHFAGFSPAKPFSQCDKLYARMPPAPIAFIVRWHSKKRKKTDLVAEKSLTNCPLLRLKQTSFVIANLLFFQLLHGGQFLADFKGKNWTLAFTTMTFNERNFGNGDFRFEYKKTKLASTDFALLQAESA